MQPNYAPQFLLVLCLLCSRLASGQAQVIVPISQAEAINPVEADLRKQVRDLQQQLTQSQSQLRQTVRDRQRLREANNRLTETADIRADSISMLLASEKELDSLLVLTRLQNHRLSQSLTERTGQLTEARQLAAHYDFDRKTLADPTVLRLYHTAPTDVRRTLLASLSRPGSGFTFDEDPAPSGQLRISRAFDNQVEAWWMFDKTIDTILELALTIKPHPFDPQRTVLVAESKLMQKSRFSNKTFELQHDTEKTNLYRDKAMSLLEGSLRGTSDK